MVNIINIDSSTALHKFPEIYNGNNESLLYEISALKKEIDSLKSEIKILKSTYYHANNLINTDNTNNGIEITRLKDTVKLIGDKLNIETE